MTNQPNLFDLDFNRWQVILLSLLPALVNIGIYIFVAVAFQRSRTKLYFSFFVLLLGIWQMSEAFTRMSISSEAAQAWYKISIILALFAIPFGLKFILNFTKWNKFIDKNLLIMLLFLPAILLFLFVEAGLFKSTILESQNWYWIAQPNATAMTLIIMSWISLGALLMFFILWLYYFKSRKKSPQKKQSLILAAGFTLPILVGILVEVIFPLLLELDRIPITVTLASLISISTLFAIKKHMMLDFSPKHQWGQIVESMNDGILITNNDDRIMYANHTFCKMLGYEFHEIKDKIAYDLLLDDIEKIKMKSVLNDRINKKSNTYEIQLNTKTGEKIWMMISGSPYLDKSGNVIGSIGVQTNITHLKDALNKIEYNESRLAQAQEIAHIGSWEINFESNKGIWSDEACRIYGVPLEMKNEQTYESWLSFIHPKDIDGLKKEIQRSRETLSPSSYHHRIVRKNGTIRHIYSESKFEFNNGIPIGLFGICHDLTEQKRIENALVESEHRITTFINESLLCIYFVDPVTKKIIYANQTFVNLLRYSPEEISLITIYDFIAHSEQDVNQRVSDVLNFKKIPTGERRWKRKDGQIVHVLVSSFSQCYGNKDTIYVAAQDISDRKRAEENMIVTNRELETFIYKASHDLRAPLASIMGLVNVSKTEIKDEISMGYLKMIDNAVQKLDYTLLELVKAMEIKNVDKFNDKILFEKLVPEVLNKFAYFKGFSRLKKYVDISFSTPFISNKSIIETILQNLIENAIKYQNYNSENSFIKINISGNSQETRLNIEDNGMGIDKSIQSQIFDMYFRGTQTSTGSGLGLYLVKKGVDKLKGEIQLNSQPGKGSSFTILLKADLGLT